MGKINSDARFCPLTRIHPGTDGTHPAKVCAPEKCAWGTGAPGYKKCCAEQIVYELYRLRTAAERQEQQIPQTESEDFDLDVD